MTVLCLSLLAVASAVPVADQPVATVAAVTPAAVASPAVVPAVAQPVQAAVVATPRATLHGTSDFLPANTQVDVTLNSEISSKKMKQGDRFSASVAHDVLLGDYVVIPKGTRANGSITYRTGKGAFGKSAKMEIMISDLDLAGRSVPVSGKFRQEGAGNTGATVGAVVAVGVFSAFVTGKSAVFEQGRELRVFTTDALPVTTAAPAPTAVASTAAAPVATPAVVTTTAQ